MNYGFWGKLEKPFFVLAPMVNVTDTVFRQIIVEHSRPDALWTEFVSCDGLCSPRGRAAVLRGLQFTQQERPLVAQIFGAKPENFYTTAKLLAELGFDGIDINMGCPDKAIMKQGTGAALIMNPTLAKEIIAATQEGVSDAGETLPVSVKTRIGFNSDEIETWIPTLLSMNIPVLTVHGRTKKELSAVPAHWDRIGAVVEMARATGTLIIGNGDVQTLQEAKQRVAETGVDGVMLGRAIFGNPWLFDHQGQVPTVREKLTVLVAHTALFEQTWGATKNFELMKKHFKAYVTGFDGAQALRMRLMECHTAKEVDDEVTAFLRKTLTSL